MEKIFEPFLHHQGSGKRTGLGLSMVHGMSRITAAGSVAAALPEKGPAFKSIYRRSNPSRRKSRPTKRGIQGAMKPSSGDDDENIRNTGQERLERPAIRFGRFRRRNGLDVYGQKKGNNPFGPARPHHAGWAGARCLQELLQTDPTSGRHYFRLFSR